MKSEVVTKLGIPISTRVIELPRTPLVIPERPLFQDSLLHVTGKERGQRAESTVIALVFLVIVVAASIIIPIWHIEKLPRMEEMTYLVAPAPPPPPPPPAAPAVQKTVRAVQPTKIAVDHHRLLLPTRIPNKVETVRDLSAPSAPPISGVLGGVPGGVQGGVAGGQVGGVLGGILSTAGEAPKLAPPPTPKAEPPKVVRISQGVSQGLLIHRVNPVYPPIAADARIQGTVVLTAIIGKDGTIENLRVVSGHPLLVSAAMAAVKQWRYRPYVLNGERLEVETTVNVTFQLGG